MGSNFCFFLQIKAILSEQRRQMEEDSKWLAQHEVHWQKNRFDSLNSTKSSAELNEPYCSEHNSTATSVYEDADCVGRSEDAVMMNSSLHLKSSSQSLNKSDQHLYSEFINLDLLRLMCLKFPLLFAFCQVYQSI